MEIDSGPGLGTEGQDFEYQHETNALGAIGVVSKTFNSWLRKVLHYLLIAGLPSIALVSIESNYLLFLFGIDGLNLLSYIGTSSIDTLFNYFILPYTGVTVLLAITILSFMSLVIFALIGGTVIHFTFKENQNPGSASIGNSLSVAADRALNLIGVQLILAAIILPLGVVSIILWIIDPLMSIVVLFFALYVAIRLLPAMTVSIVEMRDPVASVIRSWQLTSGQFGHIFISQIITGMVSFGFSILIAVFAASAVVFIIPSFDLAVIIGSAISMLLLSSIYYIFQAVLYGDLEARASIKDTTQNKEESLV